MIYHYCERRYGQRIIADGEIRPHKVFVSENMEGSDPRELKPVVWFTTDTELPMTVGLSTQQQYPGEMLLWLRFVCPDEVASLTLSEWAEKHDYPARLFMWMVKSAALAGESWREWRLSEEPVPQAKWAAVEWFNGKQWFPVDVPTGR